MNFMGCYEGVVDIGSKMCKFHHIALNIIKLKFQYILTFNIPSMVVVEF